MEQNDSLPAQLLSIEWICTFLGDVVNRPPETDYDPIHRSLAEWKRKSVESGTQDEAKRIWCLEQVLIIQKTYLEVFLKLKNGEYYEAWCSLEQIELKLKFLTPHQDFILGDKSSYKLDFIGEHVERYQGLFPYKIFMSPEFLEEETLCSTCNKRISIRKPCGHKLGEIYDGEQCSRIVTKCKVLGMAFVTNPVQKYSVGFPIDPKSKGKIDQIDPYDYTLPRYLMKRLEAPFDGWEVEWTKRRHPHSRYRDIGRNDPCPCESKRKYKKCCLNGEGVLRPHCMFSFSVPPPDDLMKIEYTER